MMNVEFSASTTGYDDAEAVATVLEKAAETVRAGGGDAIELRDQAIVTECDGQIQQVYWSLRVSA